MTIWEYNQQSAEKEFVNRAFGSSACVFCGEPLIVLTELREGLPSAGEYFHSPVREQSTHTCPICGWWNVRRRDTYAGSSHGVSTSSGAAGTLRQLDLTNIETPLDAIRSYLAARYAERFDMAPQLFEETVASVFRDLGFSARVTAYSGDGGIDIVLDGPSDAMIGVQVKRYKGTIKVEQIRAFTGALVVAGLTRGIFVTTSTFQRGVNPLVDRLSTIGYGIDLVDATRFYDALKIAQRSRYRYVDDPTAAYTNAPLIELGTAYGTY